jgi:hypothetical protein
MEPTPVVPFLLDAIRARMSGILAEIRLIDEQIPYFASVPGTSKDDRTQLMLVRNIKATLHDVYNEYYLSFHANIPAGPRVPLLTLVNVHVSCLQHPRLHILSQELFGQQSALTTRVGEEYQRVTKDADQSTDIHIKMIGLIFPYELVWELLLNRDFFPLLFTTVRSYEATKHLEAVSVIFNHIRDFGKRSSISETHLFFTAENPMYFALAEQFVSMFVHDKMLKTGWDPLRNLSVAEKCALIARQGAIVLWIE